MLLYIKGYLFKRENIPVPIVIGIPIIMHSLTPGNRERVYEQWTICIID
jgi:hypothetical protein